MSGDIAPEVVERMVDHLRKCAAEPRVRPNSLHRELMEIVALLPKPIDPDLVKARGICAGMSEFSANKAKYLSGQWDDQSLMRGIVIGLKAARGDA